jgi:hypothetical protein
MTMPQFKKQLILMSHLLNSYITYIHRRRDVSHSYDLNGEIKRACPVLWQDRHQSY